MSATAEKPATKAVAKIDPQAYLKPVKSTNDLMVLGKPLLPQITAALPVMMAKNAERFVRMLLTECSKNPRLLECTPKSLFGGVLQSAQLGLELGGAMGQAYLVPFKNKGVYEAQFIPGYKGLIKLAYNSQVVADIGAEIVREKDFFEIRLGTERGIIHRPDFNFDSPVTGYYCSANLVTGGKVFKFITKKQAEAHRDRYALYRGNEGPWFKSSESFDEMGKKTTIRMAAKLLPQASELSTASALEDMDEEGIPQHLGSGIILDEVDDIEPVDNLKEIQKRAEKNKKPKGSGENGEYVPGVDDPDADPAKSMFDNDPETAPSGK